jgi:hypothetical protein
MRALPVIIVTLALLGSTEIALSQTSGPGDQPTNGGPGTRYSRSPAGSFSGTDPLNSNVANPFGNPAPVHRGIRNPYFGEDNPYVTSTATPRRKKSPGNPADAVAQQQSGLTNADVTGLARERGYTGLNDLHADPNSVWVWQADAMKNGRRVRLGVDNRGNLLELGASTQPCASPGAGFGAGPLGTGARLSEATRCSGR